VISSAARNNAEWCASVCRSHGITTAFGERVWHSARRTPPFYPDAVTLHPAATAADFLPEIDTVSPGCSVKDSFATLDLTADGFVELFTAEWIRREPGPARPSTPTPTPTPNAALRTVRVRTTAQLDEWQAAWHGNDDEPPPNIFRPALLDEPAPPNTPAPPNKPAPPNTPAPLNKPAPTGRPALRNNPAPREDPSVLMLAYYDGADLRGGAILNHGRGLVGLSNLFAVDEHDMPAVWSSSIAAAASHFPGLPLVGYEHGDDLAHALAAGFTTLGPLRVWLRRP
jgi:hypothetical protein